MPDDSPSRASFQASALTIIHVLRHTHHMRIAPPQLKSFMSPGLLSALYSLESIAIK